MHHHERIDGNGYPDHLKEIKNWVQIVSLADVYTALRAKRIYKPAYSKEEALEIIKKGLCGKFSREYLIAFENYMKKLF